MTPNDDQFLAMALRLAERGFGRSWPNPAVGAVIVHDGPFRQVVGRGWTQAGGRPHAETVALKAAGEAARNATLYVTLEPCAHHGRTPPCADAIVEAGIKRVVYGQSDPDKRVSGAGLSRLRDAGIEVDGVSSRYQETVFWLNAGHVLRHTQNRPFVQLKLALGADGLIAPGDGAPQWVTGPPARAFGHLLRARADAVLVGRGTVTADNPSLTCRLPGMENRSPVRIVVDSKLQTEPGCNLFSDLPRVPLWLLCANDFDTKRSSALESAGAEILPIADSLTQDGLDPGLLLNVLARRGITRLLVEGGPKIAGAFWNAGLIDEAVMFISDKVVGAHGLKPFDEQTIDVLTENKAYFTVEQRMFGPDRMTVYRRTIARS